MLQSIDQLVFKQTRKHLDSLQVEILKGVLNGQKYPEIAQKYKCSKGHVKDEAYKLWQLLSKSFGEDINKSNFCAVVERLGIANSHSQLFNAVQIGNINLCPTSELPKLDNRDEGDQSFNKNDIQASEYTSFDRLLYETKLTSLSKLIELGLSAEQIAEVLDLPLDEVREAME
nr:hypothetical protein [Spirulina subsalsa]